VSQIQLSILVLLRSKQKTEMETYSDDWWARIALSFAFTQDLSWTGKCYSLGMPQDLLPKVLEQTAYTSAPIKAAGLLHIARVLTQFDREQAVRVLYEGLSLARTLPETDKQIILGEAVFLAASVDPERALRLLQEGLTNVPHRFPLSNIILVMLDHGHLEKAIGYLIGPMKPGEFPFRVAGNVMEKCPDDATRLHIFRVAIRNWIQRPVPGRGLPMDPTDGTLGFLHLFAYKWHSLPPDEATVLTEEIVASILRDPDTVTHARIGSENGVAFSSRQDYELFLLLNVLHRLMPDLLDSLLRTHDQLAAGVRRFPLGLESLKAEPRSPDVEPKGQSFVLVGNPADFASMRAKMQGEMGANFEPHFQEAARLYAEDADAQSPNSSPRECWPSTQEYRNAMFRAGKSQGRRAGSYLDRITDPDLRLFAEIEFIAALAGLPQFAGSRRVFHFQKTY
jgi:hypothetical protein